MDLLSKSFIPLPTRTWLLQLDWWTDQLDWSTSSSERQLEVQLKLDDGTPVGRHVDWVNRSEIQMKFTSPNWNLITWTMNDQSKLDVPTWSWLISLFLNPFLQLETSFLENVETNFEWTFNHFSSWRTNFLQFSIKFNSSWLIELNLSWKLKENWSKTLKFSINFNSSWLIELNLSWKLELDQQTLSNSRSSSTRVDRLNWTWVEKLKQTGSKLSNSRSSSTRVDWFNWTWVENSNKIDQKLSNSRSSSTRVDRFNWTWVEKLELDQETLSNSRSSSTRVDWFNVNLSWKTQTGSRNQHRFRSYDDPNGNNLTSTSVDAWFQLENEWCLNLELTSLNEDMLSSNVELSRDLLIAD